MNDPQPISTRDDLLRRMAERATDEPACLGYVLFRYATLQGLPTVSAAVRELAPTRPIAGRELSRLMLCRSPMGPTMPRSAEQIADAFGLDRARLLAMLREVEVADAMSGGSATSLLAARRKDEESEDGDA